MSLSMRMIANTKIYKLLKGFRNIPRVDLPAIQFLLYKFSYLIVDFPEIKEFDVNPFAIDEYGGVVLDAKVILDRKIIKEGSQPYSHLVIAPYPREYVIKYKLKNGQNIKLASRLVDMEIDVFRELGDFEDDDEDVELSEFLVPNDSKEEGIKEDDVWILEEFRRIGLDTAKSVLAVSRDDLIRRTELEEETVDFVLDMLRKEFEE